MTNIPNDISIKNLPSAVNNNFAIAVCQGPPITITTSNLINGDTVTLVPAKGPNTYIQMIGLAVQYVPGTLPFGVDYQPQLLYGEVIAFTYGDTFDVGIGFLVPGFISGCCLAHSPVAAPNQAVMIQNSNGDAPGGVVSTATPTSGHRGSSYSIGDTGTLSGAGNSAATYRVTGISGGEVTSVTVSGGLGYNSPQGCTTTVSTGSGDRSLELDVVALNGDGHLIVTPTYTVIVG